MKNNKNNKNKKIDIKNIIHYGTIFAVTLLVVIISININEISMTPDQLLKQNINVSLFNLKIIGNIILFISYITIVIYPVRQLFNKVIVAKIPPKGDKGPRGLRGKTGKNGGCTTCGDGLCYMKIMGHITDTINYWRSVNNYDVLPKNYIIKNNYIKNKIKRHCKSKEFNDILTKFGSNNKNKCTSAFNVNDNIEGQVGCGIYDYMFNMWSRWILIILIYENGFIFLDSENYTENDFESLIMDEDTDLETLRTLTTKPVISDSPNSPKSKESVIMKPILDSFINNIDDLKKNDNPGVLRGPFDEIKKYEAWYWGSDKYSKPNIIITPPPKTNPYDSMIEFDYKNTNNYYRLWSSDYAFQTGPDSNIKPFQKATGQNITILRPYHYIDETTDNPYLRTYKPLGDVVFNSNEIDTDNFLNKCLPDNIKHNKKKLRALTPNDDKYNTLLLAGSNKYLKSPLGYNLVYKSSIKKGINKYISAFNIWQPIAPPDFDSYGFIIDTRELQLPENIKTIAIDSAYNKEYEPYQPSRDLIYCISNVVAKRKIYTTTTEREPITTFSDTSDGTGVCPVTRVAGTKVATSTAECNELLKIFKLSYEEKDKTDAYNYNLLDINSRPLYFDFDFDKIKKIKDEQKEAITETTDPTLNITIPIKPVAQDAKYSVFKSIFN